MSTPKAVARTAERNPLVRVLARVGTATIGLLHILIGGIAIAVAFGAGGDADQSGALQALVDVPGGLFVVWAAIVGLVALTLWQILQSVVARKGGQRILEIAKGVVYAVLAVTAITIAAGSRQDASSTEKSASAGLLAQPGGVFVLGLIGLVVLGIGIGFIVSGVRKTFERGLALPANRLATVTVTLGRIGYIAKGIALGIVGALVVAGALTYDPELAGGLDGALKALTRVPFGVVLLVAMGLGLIAYGVFWCVRSVAIRL
ncbi:DUF1206 domain-containing protein [Leifsonia sp. NPDC058230]|uniref:DUF1206 domain-containing protein n=1 Tax=Leifsonia sp. NPDC058230 TaxID=3346391 RepID=UPI0036DBEDD3